jgi:hypothetical protein
LSPPISRTTDSYPPPAKTNKFRQILLPYLRQNVFGKVLEGFVFLVLIRLILLILVIFLEKFDNFFIIIYKKNPAPPRFFFQFYDIENLLILPPNFTNLVDFILKNTFFQKQLRKKQQLLSEESLPPFPQKCSRK